MSGFFAASNRCCTPKHDERGRPKSSHADERFRGPLTLHTELMHTRIMTQEKPRSARPPIWRLKPGSERKFRSAHPWVFSSELAASPKGTEPGELLELQDARGGFLAYGYGHPNTLIAFRTLSIEETDVIDQNFFLERLREARRLREIAGLLSASHRLCFAEGDFLPGLVIDCFVLAGPQNALVFVVQSSTAGMDRLLPMVLEALHTLAREAPYGASEGANEPAKDYAVILANDAKFRAMEGLSINEKSLIKVLSGFDPYAAKISIASCLADRHPLSFQVDLLDGQKTGFFLDQRLNVQLTATPVQQLAKTCAIAKRPLRVLDLFCYVGQWGAQLAQIAKAEGAECEVTLVDASGRALELAAENVAAQGGVALPVKADVLDSFSRFAPGSFDVVVCDPPAFIKKKKDLPTGGAAYFKVNREALKRVRRGGLFVTCSCSGLFDEVEFRAMLAKVAAQYPHAVRWIARGSHSPDHPQRPEFPQGTYLKSWLGVTS